jgi:hypothetical protein
MNEQQEIRRLREALTLADTALAKRRGYAQSTTAQTVRSALNYAPPPDVQWGIDYDHDGKSFSLFDGKYIVISTNQGDVVALVPQEDIAAAKLVEAALQLREAGQAVVDAWEGKHLAAAVRNLSDTIKGSYPSKKGHMKELCECGREVADCATYDDSDADHADR